MRKLSFALVATTIAGALSMSGPAPVQAEGWTGNVNLLLGAKALDEDDWEPIHEHGQGGLLVDFRPADWPVSIAVDFLRSRDSDSVFDPGSGLFVDVRGETSELNLGVRKIWDERPSVRPFVGGGLAHISASLRASAAGLRVSDSDNSIGFWLNGGVYWTLGESFNLGLDLRYSQASVNLFGVSTDAGGGHAGLLLGYHW